MFIAFRYELEEVIKNRARDAYFARLENDYV